jgi:hypothetical protein
MDLALLVPLSPGARVQATAAAGALVARTKGISLVTPEANATETVDVLVAEADRAGNVGFEDAGRARWIVVTIPPGNARRRLRRVRRALSRAGFGAVQVLGAEPSADAPGALVPLDDLTQVRDLFRVLTPLDRGQVLRTRAVPALCRLRCQRFAFQSFVVVARRAP